jgi:hypothetical protein
MSTDTTTTTTTTTNAPATIVPASSVFGVEPAQAPTC